MKRWGTKPMETPLKVVAGMCSVVLAGCATVTPQQDARMAAPMSPNQARICFIRQAAMLDAVVPHAVFDSGSDIPCDATLVETSQWLPATRQTIKDCLGAEELLGTKLLELIAGTNAVQSKPVIFAVGKTQRSGPPNTDLMDAVYVSLPTNTLRVSGLADGPTVTGQDYLWASVGSKERPGLFIRMPGIGRKWEYTSQNVIRLKGRDAVELMARQIAPNARYVGTVRSGGASVFDRPKGTMQLKVVTPGGNEAFAPAFEVQAGKKYVVTYTYGFSGVHFSMAELP